MTYCRYNDKIYEVDESKVLTSLPPQYELHKNGKPVGYAPCNECKLSGDIVKLCTEFVVWEEDQKSPISSPIEGNKMFFTMKATILVGLLAGMKCWMKLGIWTETGLDFVAELNKEGSFKAI